VAERLRHHVHRQPWEDLAAAGRAADKTIRARVPGVRPVPLAEALRPVEPVPPVALLLELAGKPPLRMGEWNNWDGVA
jgi:hypothetical protein